MSHKTRIGLLGIGLYKEGWDPILKVIEKTEIDYKIHAHHSQLDASDMLVFSFGYDKVLPNFFLDAIPMGLVVFHSSDLPQGRGWAPLFYTRFLRHKELVLSMIYANEEVDAGPLIAKARYPINENYDIEELRKVDNACALVLLEKYLPKIIMKKYEGSEQNGEATFYKKRKPSDSLLDKNKSISQQVDLIRSLPPEHPGYFLKDGHKEYVQIEKEIVEEFNLDKVIIQDFLDTVRL